MKLHSLILYCCLSFIPVSSFAWSGKGHRIIATIAYELLDRRIQDSLQKYLGNISIQDASTWMDDVRGNPAYHYLRLLHYINIEKNQMINDAPKPNIITELNLVIYQIINRTKYSKEQIATNLKILLHLIGDLHQPLHDGYSADRGGNKIPVTYEGTRTNLHYIWDRTIVNDANIDVNSCLQLYKCYSPRQINQIRKGDHKLDETKSLVLKSSV